MKKLLLTLSVGIAFLLSSVSTATASPALVAFAVVIGAGTAVNVENSGDDTVETLSEAKTRIAQVIKEGYSQDGPTSYKLNE